MHVPLLCRAQLPLCQCVQQLAVTSITANAQRVSRNGRVSTMTYGTAFADTGQLLSCSPCLNTMLHSELCDTSKHPSVKIPHLNSTKTT